MYFTRPIALRNPIVFYEGHLPAFSVISFLKRGLGRAGIDERLETLFARGIDPDSEQQAVPRSGADTRWPSRAAILDYARAADDEIVAAMERAEFDVTGREHAAMADGEAIFTALEHEAMHQETLLYMWRRLPVRAQAEAARSLVRARRRSATLPAHRHSRRPRHARRAASVSARGPLVDRRGRRLRLGQRVRRARRRRCPASTSTRTA